MAMPGRARRAPSRKPPGAGDGVRPGAGGAGRAQGPLHTPPTPVPRLSQRARVALELLGGMGLG